MNWKDQLDLEQDTRTYGIAAAVLVLVAGAVFFGVQSLDTGSPEKNAATDQQMDDGPGEVVEDPFYTVDDGAVQVHPVEYLAENGSVQSGTFNMVYPYNGKNHRASLRMQGLYHGGTTNPWDQPQDHDVLRLNTTIDPVNGMANAFILPPVLFNKSDETYLRGTVFYDREFKAGVTNLTVARYNAELFDAPEQEIVDGVYMAEYRIDDVDNFLRSGDQQILLGDVKTSVYYRIDRDGMGVTLK